MQRRAAPLIVMLALTSSLASSLGACSEAPPVEQPLSEQAMAAVGKDPGAPDEQLARQLDDLFTDETLGETRAAVVMYGGKIAAERYAPG